MDCDGQYVYYLFIGSEGTILFLTVLDYITSSFLDKQLQPLERIYRAWFAVFTLRLWRSWIKNHDFYTLSQNFISLNSYLCAEINAHSLILIMNRLRNSGQSSNFLPWLFGSQACEGSYNIFHTLHT